MTNPKLALIPSGYKGGTNPTVYSILPSDGGGDFTFDRASEGTRVRKDGLIEEVTDDVPRLDWSDGNCPSLLLEPQRSNLITYSEQLNNANWNKISGASVVANQIISPNGEFTADELVFDGTSFGRAEQTIAVTSGQLYAFSVYLKNKDLSDTTQVWIGLSTSNQGEYVTVTNEWQRFTTIQTANGTNEFPRIQSSENGSIYVWGCQLEENYTSSYIKTETGAVTRLADVCNNAGNSDLFNDAEGVLYAEIKALADDGTNRNIALSDSSTSNRIVIVYTSVSNQIRFYLEGSGGTITVNHTLTDVSNFVKVAIKYKSQDFSFYVNGVEVDTNISNITFSGLNDLSFYNPFDGGTSHFYGNVKDLRYYDTALTDAELTELTT